MSGRPWISLYPATRDSILAQPERDGPSDRVCGCHDPKRDDHWWLCAYHKGHNDGYHLGYELGYLDGECGL